MYCCSRLEIGPAPDGPSGSSICQDDRASAPSVTRPGAHTCFLHAADAGPRDLGALQFRVSEVPHPFPSQPVTPRSAPHFLNKSKKISQIYFVQICCISTGFRDTPPLPAMFPDSFLFFIIQRLFPESCSSPGEGDKESRDSVTVWAQGSDSEKNSPGRPSLGLRLSLGDTQGPVGARKPARAAAPGQWWEPLSGRESGCPGAAGCLSPERGLAVCDDLASCEDSQVPIQKSTRGAASLSVSSPTLAA